MAGPQTVPAGPAVAASLPAAVLPAVISASPRAVPIPDGRTATMPDGRTAQLIDLGAPGGTVLLDVISTELPGATDAVSAFWGPRWPRDIVIVVAESQKQFAALAGGGTDVAATTTADRIMFAPGAAAISTADLRIVLRHELFHYAARPDTAADAPTWLTEGVADFVGRQVTGQPPTSVAAALSGQLPTEAELATAGPGRSAAYDRAWSFASYIADAYGTDGLRALYVEACGEGHPDISIAVRNALGVELPVVLTEWRQWGNP